MESHLHILKVLTAMQSSVHTDPTCKGQSHPAAMVGLKGKDDVISSDFFSRFADLLPGILDILSALWSSYQYENHHY